MFYSKSISTVIKDFLLLHVTLPYAFASACCPLCKFPQFWQTRSCARAAAPPAAAIFFSSSWGGGRGCGSRWAGGPPSGCH